MTSKPPETEADAATSVPERALEKSREFQSVDEEGFRVSKSVSASGRHRKGASLSSAGPSGCGRMPVHTSPNASMRADMFRTVKARGAAAPRSSSSHEQGAETGAPCLGRTVYGAAKVAL